MMKDTIDVQTKSPSEKTNADIKGRKALSVESKDQRLTICAIREITGILDEDVIQAILVSGASRREIQQAYDHCHGVNHTRPTPPQPMSRKAKGLCNLIDYADTDID